MKKLIALITFMFMLCVPCSADELSAVCENGTFIGVLSSDNVITWLGVPYAKPPVGSLRWKAPEAPEASNVTFNADKFSAMPLQAKSDSRVASMMPQDEDCLYLNVWKVSDDSFADSRPVMVWIHGGSFRSNGTGEPEWIGHNLVADNHDVIVVSVGYRLGLMGFIDFSEVDGGDDFAESGNLGLLDVLQSLKWLKANIKKFGGDPNNITLFGQSSGSALISLLMTMPEAKGLFQRAILQSGSVSMSMAKKSATEDATLLAKKLLEFTGKTDMAGLMTVSSMDLQEASAKLDGVLNFPERDGVILSEDVYAAFAANAGNYDILIGSNADEANYFLGALGMDLNLFSTYVETVYEQIKAGAGSVPTYGEAMVNAMEQFITLQGKSEPVWAYTEFINDLLFRVPAIQMASLHSGKTYMYYWDLPSIIPLLGACHGSEIPYVLGVPGVLVPELVLNSTLGKTIRTRIQGIWIDFAKDGELDEYSMYTENNRTTIVINQDLKLISEENDPLSQQRELVTPLLALNISGRDIINAISGSPSSGESEENIDDNDDEITIPDDETTTPDEEITIPDESEENVNDNNDDETTTPDEKTTTPILRENRGSSSGCNVGILPFMLMLLIPVAIDKNKRYIF